MHPTRENELQGQEKASDMVLGPRNAKRVEKIKFLASLGLVSPAFRLAVIKSAAGAASLEGFQAVIQSAASAAFLRTKNPRKDREKIHEKIDFCPFCIRIPRRKQRSSFPTGCYPAAACIRP